MRAALAAWGRRRTNQAAAFARQVVLGAPVRDVAADALFAEAVVNGGINVIDAGVEHGVEDRFRLGLGDVTAARRPTQFHGAIAQHSDLKPGPSEGALGEISHRSVPFRKICASSLSMPTRSLTCNGYGPYTRVLPYTFNIMLIIAKIVLYLLRKVLYK